VHELAPHQRDAVRRALALIAAHGGAVLADEVGTGKSFVAATVARELQRRGSEVDLIVPASLVRQWRETLHEFGVDARILTHDALASDASLSQRERLLVVDEAHAFRNRQTQRWRALARRSVASRLLLVTATPVCNRADDLLSLISLIAADDALRTIGVASIDDAFATNDRDLLDVIVAALVIRHSRDVLPPALQFGRLDRHVVRHAMLDVPIDRLRFPLSGSAPLLRQFLWRRLESSPEALLESVRRQLRFYERVIESGRALTRREYRQAFAAEEDAEAFQQILFWELLAAPATLDTGAVRDEMQRLTDIRSVVEHGDDTKVAMLEALLSSEPTLIFTGAAATARSLARRLRCGLATSKDGTAAIDAFRRCALDLVVATDLASEGLNLQRAAVVVHYDIPWNPVKLDQRNGRAHRIGQSRGHVKAIYFLPESRSRVVTTIASKNRTRRRLLGSKSAIATIDAPSLVNLPQHLPRDSPALELARAIRGAGWVAPAGLDKRHRAGIEQLFREMTREYLDEARIAELARLLDREQSLRGFSSGASGDFDTMAEFHR